MKEMIGCIIQNQALLAFLEKRLEGKMDIKEIVAIGFGIFVVLLIAATGAFSEIIKGFTSAMGVYGLIIGVLIVIVIIVALLGAGGRRR